MALSLAMAAAGVDGGLAGTAVASTSSHFCSAEKQFRYPLEYGSQRAPASQRTVTGSGAFIIGKSRRPDIIIPRVQFGIITDAGMNDTSNMGAAMAPAAADTLVRFFRESNTVPADYDLIVTGDLGYEGGDILCELMALEGVDISPVYNDCGMMIYDRKTQDTHAGGSGCGCSAAVLACHLLPRIERGELKRILLLGTGAMMSPQSIQQGEYIPAVAHLVCLAGKEDEWTLS